MPRCLKCGQNKKHNKFSKKQLRKGKGRRCKNCISSKHRKIQTSAKKAKTHKIVSEESWSDISLDEEDEVLLQDTINPNINNHTITIDDDKSNTSWIQCNKISFEISQIIKLNNYTFLISSKSNKVYIYQTQNDQLTQQINLNIAVNIKSIAFDQDSKELWILGVFNKNKGRIMRFKYNHNHKKSTFSSLQFIELGKFSDLWTVSSVFADGKYHFIRDRYRNILQCDSMAHRYIRTGFHFIYDPNTKKVHQPQTAIYPFYGEPLIYFKEQSKPILYFFLRMDTLRTYSFITNQWSEIQTLDSIRRDSWRAVCHGCMLSEDKKRMLIFGAVAGGKLKIYEIDCNDNIYKNKAKCRTIGFPKLLWSSCACTRRDCVILSSNNDVINPLFMSGYYRICWNDKNVPILPLEIVEIICFMNKERFIHAFSKRDGFHFKLDICDLHQH